ncbi:hypothetical protein I6I10_04620 [Corynebacterium glucuronolyticum]|uniref:Uncharacterized protein n=1 Tax=Corynebacterium glucuronolyticum TaxID=39791 RepID=A0A7T4EGY0_9CORY|nr:hypothetical protein [Corynebacterium glucuronolyticum]QQB47196.1 hypothetical protein I6I10_04620 [Corynebacterium glucuronolyticum]QQU88854.1 hypothetical protein I6I68_02375 [Corynebacterium glucuronolyticum]WKD64489.1 hypothetical protein CGLUCO_11350 [Corynebacterium glucuronolyticum DSM 44120]SMB82656.1 hypothetical protein SAMN05660745_00868 [Corynebacterium glucuronolyticum]
MSASQKTSASNVPARVDTVPARVAKVLTRFAWFLMAIPLVIGVFYVFIWAGIPFNHGYSFLVYTPGTIEGRVGIARADDGATELLYQPCGTDAHKLVVTNFEGPATGVEAKQPLGSNAQVWVRTGETNEPFTARLFPPTLPPGWSLESNTYPPSGSNGPSQPLAAYTYTDGEGRSLTGMPVRVTAQSKIEHLGPDKVLVNEYKPLVMTREDFFNCKVATPELPEPLVSIYGGLWLLSGVYTH